jgi:hypothetical protein
MSRDEDAERSDAAPPAQQDTQPEPPAPGRSRRLPPQEVLDDWKWIDEESARGGFAAYRGQHIAVVGKRVVGHGNDTNALLREVAEALQVPLPRVVITYAGGEWD